MNAEVIDPAKCPLCGGGNDCQMCTSAVYKGSCWCETVTMPVDLLALVPVELKNKACICLKCATEFHRHKSVDAIAGDYYFEEGKMVFTRAYLLRRGYCCGSGCRHCPYTEPTSAEARA